VTKVIQVKRQVLVRQVLQVLLVKRVTKVIQVKRQVLARQVLQVQLAHL
jgi:hypothetical protein